LDKYTKPELCGLPTADELRAALLESENSDVRAQLAMLFDDASFVEISAYAKRGFSDFVATEKSNELEGVICGYGAIDGKLVFAFAEDASRMGGAIDERHAKKVAELYNLAMKNGAPVVGIFNSNGTDIFTGTAGLAAYGKMLALAHKASGVIPSDLMSVIYGAMGVNFWKFFIASNLGMLPFNVLFSFLANKGDLSNPYSLLYIIPIPIFVVIMSVVVKKMTAKKDKA
jgi:hypothetical protein